MGDRTGISWTDATWNPIRGCSRVSQGCVHCYAETVAARFSKPGQAYDGLVDKNGRWNGKIMTVPAHLRDPIRWRRPRRIFVNSMSDLFHENVPEAVIDDVFAVMALAPRHTFQVLTKRPQRMLEYLTTPKRSTAVWWSARPIAEGRGWYIYDRLPVTEPGAGPEGIAIKGWPLANVWLGVSTEDQPTADERIPLLLQTPAAVRFISAEPLIGPLDLQRYLLPPMHVLWGDSSLPPSEREQPSADDVVAVNALARAALKMHGAAVLDWVIVGGESGPAYREALVQWYEYIQQQCAAASVPLFVKQDSGSRPGQQGRLSDDLWQFKEFPKAAPA